LKDINVLIIIYSNIILIYDELYKSTGKLNIAPLSMTRLAPVINCASVEDKNTIPFAISRL
jgi:hypothetical protein